MSVNQVRAQYTQEFKLEAVRQGRSGQDRDMGIVDVAQADKVCVKISTTRSCWDGDRPTHSGRRISRSD